ncbi:receptor like protein kinase S.2 [Aristolochia californica]|uniref:receptor like protein kinase S.2 n=1 Tax=Aristolochia californica TaxID=171875 RepID=UPI0035DC4F30
MVMQQLNRLCLILPADLDEIEFPLPTPRRNHHRRSRRRELLSKRAKRLRSWIAAFLRRFRWKCQYPLPDTLHSQPFKDTDGVLLNSNSKALRHNPRIFTYSELYIASNGFCDKELLGSGGFGRVYRALLPSDGTVVAVKCVGDKAERIEKTFLAELAAVAQLRHRNLVRLRGWCFHEDELLLVYDFMPNRSLDRVLFRNPYVNSPPLSWEQRTKIVFGLAAALFYLHEQLDTQIIHRDVKTSNVMLDSEFNARLGDFGLARWLEHDFQPFSPSQSPPDKFMKQNGQLAQFRLTQTSRIGGTIGYLPPESFNTRSLTTAKSDVFSFGIVILEVISGRRAVDLTYPEDQIVLLDWVRRLSDEGKSLQAGDTRLPDGSYALSDMKHLLHLGLLCTLHDPQSRPSMKWVMQILSCDLTVELPELPSFRSHPRYISYSSSSTTTTTTGGGIATTSTTITSTPASLTYVSATGTTIFITADNESGGSTNSEKHRRLGAASISVDTPHEIPYSEIVSATENFSEAHMVAEMDFGTAYHAYLKNGLRILVKRLGMKTCPALRARFSDELRNLGSLRHRNLVQLRGWCTEQGEMLVVYDYLPHRSLSHLLFHHSDMNVLKWSHRYNIVKSLASAILYLHEEWEEQVIHRSITSSSVFLDGDMNPRLGSFALAEFLTRNANGHHVSNSDSCARGIFGYMSPEYMESGTATTMADVYSFGVVVLEIVIGRKAVDFRWPHVLLVKRVHEFETEKRPLIEMADSRLEKDYDPEELLKLMELGLACTRTDPRVRPSMRQIVSVLDGKNDCLHRTKPESLKEERREDWEEKNASSLSLIKRIQALGIH